MKIITVLRFHLTCQNAYFSILIWQIMKDKTLLETPLRTSLNVNRSYENKSSRIEAQGLPPSLADACMWVRESPSSGVMWHHVRALGLNVGIVLASIFEKHTNYTTVHGDPVFLKHSNWSPIPSLSFSGFFTTLWTNSKFPNVLSACTTHF